MICILYYIILHHIRVNVYCYISYLEIKSLFHQMDGWGRFIFPSSYICISIWWLDCFVHLLTCLKKIIHLSSRLYLDLCIIPSNGFAARASAVHLIWTIGKSFSAKIQDDLKPLYELWAVASRYNNAMPHWFEDNFEGIESGELENTVDEWLIELKRL